MTEHHPFADIREMFIRYGFSHAIDKDWRPTPEDWVRLSIGLAVKHGEAGFSLSHVDHRPAAHADWVRFVAMDNRYLGTDEGGSLSTRKREGMTMDKAARETARHLDKEIKAGRLPGVKSIDAASLKSAYSKHRASLKRGGRIEVDPTIADYLRKDRGVARTVENRSLVHSLGAGLPKLEITAVFQSFQSNAFDLIL